MQAIVARAAVEAVAAALAVELIVALAAGEDVVALAANQLVVAGAAVERVRALAVFDDVAAPTAEHRDRDGHVVVDRALVVAVAEIDVDRTRGRQKTTSSGYRLLRVQPSALSILSGP